MPDSFLASSDVGTVIAIVDDKQWAELGKVQFTETELVEKKVIIAENQTASQPTKNHDILVLW